MNSSLSNKKNVKKLVNRLLADYTGEVPAALRAHLEAVLLDQGDALYADDDLIIPNLTLTNAFPDDGLAYTFLAFSFGLAEDENAVHQEELDYLAELQAENDPLAAQYAAILTKRKLEVGMYDDEAI